jgi:LacI family transcriptional regulator
MADTPTLKDVAKKLGISVAAVSLGLRRAGNISAATCKRIEAAAQEMGYRPNPHAAALSTRANPGSAKGVPLAVLRRPLNPNSGLYPIPAIVEGIVERSEALGYRVECFDVQKTAEIPRVLKMLFNRGFLGIFVPPIGDDFQAENFDWSAFSVIACGRYDKTSAFHTVRQEIFESTRFLLNQMIQRGYRRICLGLLRHDPPLLDDFARIAVAETARPPGGCRAKVFFSRDDGGYDDFVKWAIKEKADAAVGFSVGHYYALVDAGVRVPEDMAFAALHHFSDGENGVKISGLSPLDKQCGVVAANRMDMMIRHHERGIPAVAEQIALRSDWHPGETMPLLKRA